MSRAPQRRRQALLEDIYELSRQGLSRAAIASRLGYSSRDAVDVALARYAREGLPDYSRRGRPRPINHGTRHAYDRRGCRCPDCRACNAQRARAQRAARRNSVGQFPQLAAEPSEGA